MKKISSQQCEAILQELMKLNVPVQSFSGIQKMFESLESVVEPKAPSKEKVPHTAQ